MEMFQPNQPNPTEKIKTCFAIMTEYFFENESKSL